MLGAGIQQNNFSHSESVNSRAQHSSLHPHMTNYYVSIGIKWLLGLDPQTKLISNFCFKQRCQHSDITTTDSNSNNSRLALWPRDNHMTSYRSCKQANSHAKLDQHKELQQRAPTICENFLLSSGLCHGLTSKLLADPLHTFQTSLIELPIHF